MIYEGPKELATTGNSQNDELLSKFGIAPQKYLLHAGSMFKRKNIPALIEAFAKVKASYPDLKLVLAGPTPANIFDSDYKLILDAIEIHSLNNDVLLTGYLTDSDLGALYQNALLYVFPSTNEGFGIPVLEAFKNNLPVLVANNTCLPEVGGNAVLQFNPFDIQDMAAKIRSVLDDPELRQDMKNKGRERLKLFAWRNTALQLVEVFKKAV